MEINPPTHREVARDVTGPDNFNRKAQTPILQPKAYRLQPRASPRFRQKPPKTRLAPTHARHKSCNRKKSRVSLYVTFDFAALARIRSSPEFSRRSNE
ncbi:MAG: hypothetical protein AMXMBFR20_17370 [Planctomycetia bacterium]